MYNKILSILLVLIILTPYTPTNANVDEEFEWSIEQWSKSFESLKWQKVWFLVEWTDLNGNIKRDEYGYLIDDFLKNDSVKNINSWFNGDYWNVRVETSSSANIASYFPSVFNWNIPHKIYEIQNWDVIEASGEEIYTTSEKDNLCTYGFTRSIDSVNDITTKVDVYWVSENGDKLIGKDTYNSAILSQVERSSQWWIDEVDEFIQAISQNAILIENNGKHEVYNYSNYGWSLKQSIMWPDMSKYSVRSYLEKVQNDLGTFDSEIRFSDIKWNETSQLWNNKVSNHISYEKVEDVFEERYFIINNNKFVWDNGIVTIDVDKLFIQYQDLINWVWDVDSDVINKIKLGYGKNIISNVVSLLWSDANNLYEKWRIKNSLLLIASYLDRMWVSVPIQYENILLNNELYDSTLWDEYSKLVGVYYIKFLETLELDFKTLYTDVDWNTSIIPLENNFNTQWPIGTLEELTTNIGFHLYDTDNGDSEIDFSKTITYGDTGSSFGVFPQIKLESWEKVSFSMGFSLPENSWDEIKKIYNSIIGGSDLAIENIENTEFNYVYWATELIKESPLKNGKLSLKFLYNSPGILDFFFKNNINDEDVLKWNNLINRVALSFNYFNNWDSYNIRDISKIKQTTKHPYVFPVSYYISKDEREYSFYWSGLKKLKDGETSYFKTCLNDTNIKKLLKATPESDVFTKKVSQNGKEYLVTYKVLEMQYKFAWELTMGSDFWFYGDFPPEQSINLWNFMNTNPLKDKNYQWEDLKIENFLSWKNINVWSWFANRSTDKYSYGFRVFRKAWDNLVTYKENWASNRLYDPNSWHLFQPIKNTLKEIGGNTFWNWAGEIIIETWENDTTLQEFNYNNDLYASVSCPRGYELYDDYQWVYSELLKSVRADDWKWNLFNKYPLLENLNYRRINGIEHQAITGFFNEPRPFCIHESLNKDTDSVIKYITRMFIIDEWGEDLELEDKYNYILQNNTNPFMYFDQEKWNFKFSTVYLNTLRSLFTSEYQRFPTYNKVSENLDKLYTWDLSKEILGYVDYTWKESELVDNLLLYNVKKDDDEGINFNSKYKSQRTRLISLLEDLDKLYFSWIYWINLLKNSGGNYEDFSDNANADIFPIVGAIKVIKKSWIDFFCKDSSWNKTNSLIIKWKCISKTTGEFTSDESLYINKGTELAKSNGAFVNNTTLLPFFKPGISIKDTSWTLFLNKDKNSQEALPFISDVEYNSSNDDINFKPRVTALRGINTSELIEEQLNQWYGFRAGGFLYPYSKFIDSSNVRDFNNLLINSSINTEDVQLCINIFNPSESTKINNWTCPAWHFVSYQQWSSVPFIFHDGSSNTLWVKDSDYSTIDVPLSFWDIQINKDIEYYANSNVLNKKAEFVAGKSSILVYTWDYQERNREKDLLTGYVKSDKHIDAWEFMFLSINNSSTWLNNNSVLYEISSHFIPEVCLFGDENINACIQEYNTFDYTFINSAWSENIVSEEKVCKELDGTDRVYTVGSEAENDIDQTGFCNLSCVTVNGEERVFSSNNYNFFTENQGDPVCLESEPTKLKIIDGYSVNNFISRNDTSVDLGKYYEKGTGLNGTGIPINDDEGVCYYNSDPEFEPIQCIKWFLSRYNNEIEKNTGDLKNNPSYRNSYLYADNIELWKKVSTNFNWVLNNDLVILTSNQSAFRWEEYVVEGWYIWYNSSIVDNISWWIREPYIFSDNDNPLWEGEVNRNPSLSWTNTKEWRQDRRDRIKNQVRLSAGNNSELLVNPRSWLNYISYKIDKDDFYSLNGVLRIAKDSTQYFTNVKIQNPDNESELLADVDIFDTVYSHNNLTIKYGNQFYTWWENSESCNGVNPNEVFNKIDLYDNISTSREDTITICLSNRENLSQRHELSNDIYILLPVKPTKWYNKYNISWGVEQDNQINSSIVNINGVINGTRTRRDTTFPLNTYFQWYFTNKYNAFDHSSWFLDIFDSGTRDYGVKWRYVEIRRYSERDRCDDEPDGRDYWYEWFTEYAVNFSANKILLNNAPKMLSSGFITKQDEDKSIFVLPINFSQTSTNYSWSEDRKDLRRWATRGYGCDSDSDEKREARREAREAMTQNIEFYNQNNITFGSVSTASVLWEYNKWNIVNSYYVPPSEPINTYTDNISYTSQIKDTYYKAGNLLNNLWTIKSNENYVKGSLQENNNKVSVGDYLEFEHEINVSWEVTPQLMFLKTQLDRWLDIDISTLEFEKNGFKQTPIYVNDDETKEIIWDKYNTKYVISEINTSSNNESEVFESNNINKYNDTLRLSRNQKITVTEGKLFLEIQSPTAKVYGTKWTEYWRGSNNDITLIFERNNGIIKDEDLSDIFSDLWTDLEQWDILTIWAWEYVRFADSSVNLRVIGFNSLPEYLLNYDKEKVMQDDQIVGIPFIDSWFENLEINPWKTQPYYVFRCDRLWNEEKFRKSNTTINFTDSIGANYCWVYNKYTDLVFNGYLNAMSSYNRLVLPSEEYRFSLWDSDDDNAKLLWQHAKYDWINLSRNSRGYRNGDREKQMLVNLWMVKQWDIIRVTYKAKVNNYNDNGHVLYAYTDNDSRSIQIQNEDNDTLLWSIHETNTDIYTKSINSQVFFLTHYGDEVNIFDQEHTLESWESVQSKIEVTPNVDLSIINLSWRKWYIGCNPLNETKGTCNQFYTVETLNRDGEDNASDGEVIKKDWDSQAILYKWQKFFLRATITNDYIDKSSSENTIRNLDLKLWYNSDLILFDGVVVENSFNSDTNVLQNSLWEKNTVRPEDLEEDIINQIAAREDYIQDIENSSISSSYKQINYSVDTNSYNNEWGITVDYLFTIKNSLNAENIKELFWTAFLKDIGWVFILNTEFEKDEDNEVVFPISNWNSAFQEEEDYNWNILESISNLFRNTTNIPVISNDNSIGWVWFQYYKMPFTDNYKFLEEEKDFITNLNPNLAVFNARIVNFGWTETGWYTWGNDDWELALELTISNTSNIDIDLVRDGLKFSLPNGFELDTIEYTSLDDSSKVSVNLVTETLYGTNLRDTVEIDSDYWKKTYTLNQENDTLIPGEKVQYLIYLDINRNEVDLFSTFTANVNILRENTQSTLFTDTWINIDKGLWDLAIKSLPIISENDAYFGAGFIKNKVTNQDLIENNNGESQYNTIAWRGSRLEYGWSNANNKVLDGSIQPLIYNITDITNEIENNYSVVSWDDLLSISSITFIPGSDPYYSINPDSTWNINLTNNTLYYFWDYDVQIWSYSDELWDLEFNALENTQKNNFAGITLFTKGTLSVNNNISLINNSGTNDIRTINYVAFMWNTIEINPRVSSIEWSYIAPLSNNSYMEVIEDENSIEYVPSWSIWVFRPWYSNIPLSVKWNVIWGNIIRERTINEVIEDENLTEKYEFDYKLYLWIPPVLRK